MFTSHTYSSRRATLRTLVGSGVILLPGNDLVPNSYPNNAYYFRQDSTFRYYFGIDKPSFVGVIDADSGEEILFGDDFTVDDIIWTGPQPLVSDMAREVGVGKTQPLKALQDFISKTIVSGRRVHYLPPYRGETKIQLSTLLNTPLHTLHQNKSADLIFAVAQMREEKSGEEVRAIEDAIKIGYKMHTKAMKMCREDLCEREVAGALEGIARSEGQGVSFQSITSQHGETLHNINQTGILENGRLFLCDAGAESLEGYCSDHTRTYPVSGKFSDRQRDIYNIVLNAHDEVIRLARPMMYQDLHTMAQRTMAEGLIGVGLLQGTADEVMESGAMSLFMPHGLGHGLGMDVHDCEAFGERSFDFSEFIDRATESATCVYRKTWRLRPNTVMTNEPGIYFIPELIDKSRSEGLYKGIVHSKMLEDYRTFGGIRIGAALLIT